MKTLFLILFSFSLYAQNIITGRGSGSYPDKDTTFYYLISNTGDTLLSNEGDTLKSKSIQWAYENFNINNSIFSIESGADLRCWADKRKHLVCSRKGFSTV